MRRVRLAPTAVLAQLDPLRIVVGSKGLAEGKVLKPETREVAAAAGAHRVLCVNQQIGNQGLDARCRGLARAMRGDILASDGTRVANGHKMAYTIITDTGLPTAARAVLGEHIGQVVAADPLFNDNDETMTELRRRV